MVHVPVLQKEVIEYLDPKPNENFIDCTIGGAGHTLAILEKTGPRGKVLGIDWDQNIIKNLGLKKRVVLACDNFVNLKEIVKREQFKDIAGILFDLGMSSWHLEESGRGFSFLRREPLDMRYSSLAPLTAEKIVNYWSEPEIERILREFGEERFSGKIAEEIVEGRKIRPIQNTVQLIEILKRAVPFRYQRQRIHFATRTFQALRISVNSELKNLEEALPQALEILKPEGRLAVISFHSLEDRIVKNFLKEKERGNLIKILTKKPITPSFKEIKLNSRARSAKLRAAIKII